MLTALRGWRTIILNIIAGVPAYWDVAILAVSAFVPAAEQYGLFEYIPDKFKPVYVAVLVVMNVILRTRTTTPVGKKL